MVKRKIKLRGKPRPIEYPVKNYSMFLSQTKEYFRRNTILFRCRIDQEMKFKLNPVDFKFIKPIGIGTFGLVYLAELKCFGDLYAIKVLRKKTIYDSKATTLINRHRLYIEGLMFPFCQQLVCSFQDSGFLFLCQPLMTGGDLFWHLSQQKRFYEPIVVFYAGQIVLAIEYLHTIGIVHRNIKPENILMDDIGYLKLTGFTFAKKIRNSLTYSMCGTPEYMAPEMILQSGHTRAVDLWALGVLIYELTTGFTPFRADNIIDTYEKVLKANYNICADFSLGLEELLLDLLKIEPLERIGMRRSSIQEIKDTRWFQDMDWMRLVNQDLHAPFIPPNEEIDSNFPEMEDVRIVPPEEDAYIDIFKAF